MNISAETADKIAASYGRVSLNCHGRHNPVEAALAEVIRRQGGLCAALNEDARRDLILTLGDHRREREHFNIRSRAQYAAWRAELSHAAK